MHKLTKRKLEVLALIYEGLKAKEIAENLFIAQKTVETHISHLLKIFKVKKRTQLIKKTWNNLAKQKTN